MKVMKKTGFVLLCILVGIVLFTVSFLCSVIRIVNQSRTPWDTDWDDSMGTILRDVDLNEEQQTGYDLYLPKTHAEHDSLILYIHGGGFTGGDKAEGERLCKYYTARGYVCASVNYTLADGKHSSDLNLMYDQIHAQVESILSRAGELGYSITEMATTGESAGGCLAMLYAYRAPEQSPVPVRFVFQMTGPATFEPDLWGSTAPETAADFVTMMSGTPVTPDMVESGAYRDIVDHISPAALVNGNTVPTILAYGPKDKVVPTSLKFVLMEAFDQYGVTYDYIEFPHSGHTLALDHDKSQTYAATVDSYLNRYFENHPEPAAP